MSNASIRQFIKNQRSELKTATTSNNSLHICQSLIASDYLQNAQHIALYMCVGGEVNLENVLLWIWEHTHKHAYLPVTDKNTMTFKKVTADSKLIKNVFGILEPNPQCENIDPSALDTVLTPLVAFNSKGQRLGMGGGFYDRTFSFKQQTKKPYLIGCAHALQQNEQFKSEIWDVDLDNVITQNGFLF